MSLFLIFIFLPACILKDCFAEVYEMCFFIITYFHTSVKSYKVFMVFVQHMQQSSLIFWLKSFDNSVLNMV